MTRKCERCKQHPAEWALQYIGEDKPTFSTLGSHYRGFRLIRLCDECKEAIIKEASDESAKSPG